MIINLSRNLSNVGETHNYIIAGNISKEFALGDVGSKDDFYLVGTEPLEEAPYPLLSGNILDSNGEIMFMLVRNILVNNPKNCYKIVGDSIGYEIVDGEGHLIMKVETKYYKVPELPEGHYFFTTIKANFYNKNKELVFKANSGEPDEKIISQTKTRMGGIALGYSESEMFHLNCVFANHGKIYEPLTGLQENTDINLDGKFLHNVTLKSCNITIATGDFVVMGNFTMDNSKVFFDGSASNIYNIITGNVEH